MRLIALSLLLVTAPLSAEAAGGAVPATSPIPCGDQAPTFECGGLNDEKIEPDDLKSLRVFDAGLFSVRLGESVTPSDSVYIHARLLRIVPVMAEIVGPPVGLDTLTLSIMTSGTASYSTYYKQIRIFRPYPFAGYDEDDDGLVDEDPFDGRDNDGDGRIDEDRLYARSWDNLFIHELTHAFHHALLDGHPYPSWLTEGMAEAGRYCVSERGLASGDDFRYRRFDTRMATFDLMDSEAAQVLGGPQTIYYRINATWTYHAAGATVLLPVLAEIAAGRTAPHPLWRLADALRQEYAQNGPYASAWEAIDRAFSTPVDGLFPPSRWLCGRAIANRWVRDGAFLYIGYNGSETGLNPRYAPVEYFERSMGEITELLRTNPLVFTGSDGRQVVQAGSVSPYLTPRVPDLPPGAYAVSGQEEHDGQTVTDRSWILKTPSGRSILDGREGITVIFVGRDGLPVDPPDWRVNGQIVEKVPGGAVVRPASGRQPDGALTFTSGDRILGTVTVPGPLSRVVPLFVEDEIPPGVVWWLPYRPAAGESLTVWLRPFESALAGLSPIPVTLGHDDYEQQSQGTLQPVAGTGLWRGTIAVPAELPTGYLEFGTGGMRHGGIDNDHPSDYYAFPILAAPLAGIIGVERIDDTLQVTFSKSVVPENYILEISDRPGGPWRTSPDAPRQEALRPQQILWPLQPAVGRTRYLRIVTAEEPPRILYSGAIGSPESSPRIAARAPFPNPSPDGVRWSIALDTPQRLTFEVYDLQGRRVHGPEQLVLGPGQREIQWNGMTNRGPLASGIYLLRLSGPQVELHRKVLLMRDRVLSAVK